MFCVLIILQLFFNHDIFKAQIIFTIISLSNTVCEPVNNNFNDGSGKCGPDWGRCNAFLNPKHMYCDIFNEACHDDMDIKMATGNDMYDWQPEISCERKF